MKYAIIALLLMPVLSRAQVKVFDKNTYTWSEVQHIADSIGQGYHVPTLKQLDSIFKASYDSYMMASKITSGTVWSSTDSIYVGIMRGDAFRVRETDQGYGPLRFNFILIK